MLATKVYNNVFFSFFLEIKYDFGRIYVYSPSYRGMVNKISYVEFIISALLIEFLLYFFQTYNIYIYTHISNI